MTTISLDGTPPQERPKYGKGHRRIDMDRLRELYDQGLNDRQIAPHFNVSSVAVRVARNRIGLRSHQWAQQAKKPAKPAKPAAAFERVHSVAPVLVWLKLNGVRAARDGAAGFVADGQSIPTVPALVEYANRLRAERGALPFVVRQGS